LEVATEEDSKVTYPLLILMVGEIREI